MTSNPETPKLHSGIESWKPQLNERPIQNGCPISLLTVLILEEVKVV